MLDRWGTMSFAEVLAPAIDMADNGFPLNERLAGSINGSKKLRKYPSSARVYYGDGRKWMPGDLFTNKDLARTLRRIVEAELEMSPKGRRVALKAGRDRFYRGDIAREMGEFSEKNGGLFRYADFAAYEAKVEKPVSTNYRGFEVLKNPSASQGPAELLALNILEQYDLKKLATDSAGVYSRECRGRETGLCGSRIHGRRALHKDPVGPAPFKGIRHRAEKS